MTRYWFEFNDSSENSQIKLGCGVTAFSHEDALKILEETLFKNKNFPIIKKCIDNIDIRDLDQKHIIPNMWTPNFRGIWYPIGFQNFFDYRCLCT